MKKKKRQKKKENERGANGEGRKKNKNKNFFLSRFSWLKNNLEKHKRKCFSPEGSSKRPFGLDLLILTGQTKATTKM